MRDIEGGLCTEVEAGVEGEKAPEEVAGLPPAATRGRVRPSWEERLKAYDDLLPQEAFEWTYEQDLPALRQVLFSAIKRCELVLSVLDHHIKTAVQDDQERA